MKNFFRIFKEEFWCGKGCGLSFRSISYIAYMSIVIAYKSSKPLPLMAKLLSTYVGLFCGNLNEVYKNPKKFKNKFFLKLRNACFELNYKWVDDDLYSYCDWRKLLRTHPDLETFYTKRAHLCEKLAQIAGDDLRWNYDTIEKFWDWNERGLKEKKKKRR
jgi:hypothetical protein